MAQKVVIIGAGIGGLGAANLLAKAGYEVHVYEKEPSAGGRAGKRTIDGFTFDTGPSWYLMPEVFAHHYALLDEHIEDWLDLVRLDPAYTVFFEGEKPVTIHSDLARDSQTFEAIEPGSGKQLERYVTRGDDIYQLSLKHFLYSNFERPTDLTQPHLLKRLPEMLTLMNQPIHRYVATQFKDQRLQQILEYPMVFLGTSPFEAPAMYSLMSALDFREGVFYPRGGIYKIIESLQAIGTKLGVNYHYQSEVTHINTEVGRATGITLSGGSQVNADIIISNCDVHHTETKLLQNVADRTYPASYWQKKAASPSALLLYLGVRGELPELAHHNLFFAKDWQANFNAIYKTHQAPEMASIYLSKTSQTDPGVAPEGHETLFVLVPLPAGVDFDQTAVAELSARYLNQIDAMTGLNISSRIVSRTAFGPNNFRDNYYSWQSSMLGQSHILKQSAFFRTPNKSKKLRNLYYVGANTTPGIGMPMCLIGAELVYKRIVGDKRGGPVETIRPIDTEQH